MDTIGLDATLHLLHNFSGRPTSAFSYDDLQGFREKAVENK